MQVKLYSAGGTLIATTMTNASGLYSFTGVASGDYYLLFGPGTITFTIQDAGSDDSLDSDPNSSGQTAVFTLAPGQTRTDLDAGVAPPSGFSLSLLSSGPPSQPLDGYFTLAGAVGFLAEETSQSGATVASESDADEPDTPSAGEAVETALFGFSPETVDLLFSSLGETSEAEEMAEVLAVSLVSGLEPVLPG